MRPQKQLETGERGGGGGLSCPLPPFFAVVKPTVRQEGGDAGATVSRKTFEVNRKLHVHTVEREVLLFSSSAGGSGLAKSRRKTRAFSNSSSHTFAVTFRVVGNSALFLRPCLPPGLIRSALCCCHSFAPVLRQFLFPLIWIIGGLSPNSVRNSSKD